MADHYEPTTVAEAIYWAYGNLAMAQDAIKRGIPNYDRLSYTIRMRLFKGLLTGKMQMSSLFSDERWKMENGARCVYCGSTDNLSVDHLLPRIKGGEDDVDNLVCSCRTCNSSKGKKDLMTWYKDKGGFPPLMILRRYLKLISKQCIEKGILEKNLEDVDDSEFPFKFSTLPMKFPKPTELTM